jgi:hypothetical protein
MTTEPNRNPVVIGKHGFPLQYLDHTARAVVIDEQAGYVDDILDCFDTWDGKGSLKAYSQYCFRKELEIVSDPVNQAEMFPQGLTDTFASDLLLSATECLKKKIQLLDEEPEDGLLKVRIMYLQSPAKTIARMLTNAKQNGQHYVKVER